MGSLSEVLEAGMASGTALSLCLSSRVHGVHSSSE